MAINLKDPQSLKGALDALKTILKSRKDPVVVIQQPTTGPSTGPQLQLPKNNKIKKVSNPSQNNDENEDENEEDNQNNPPENDQSKSNSSKDAENKNSNTKNNTNSNSSDELDDIESQEDRQARLDRIQKSLDADEIARDIETIKQDTQLRQNDILKAKKNAAAELTKEINGADLKPFSSFSADLFKAINSQVKVAKHKEDTYRRPNPSYAGTDYLMPGKDYPNKKEVPVIAVYFDQSGSWNDSDIKKGIHAIASIRQFEVQKKVKIKLFYFADNVHDKPEPARYECTTKGYSEILKHIENPLNKITNAIIISDHDIESQTKWNQVSKVRIKGCVWFLWKKGSRSVTAPKYLKGERGNFEYNME